MDCGGRRIARFNCLVVLKKLEARYMSKKRVCIVQPVMKQYRVPFFMGLQKDLRQRGIELQVVYGTPWKAEAKRGDNVDLPSPLGRRVRSWYLWNKVLVIPTVWPWLKADLVIVEQANKNLLNYFLIPFYKLGLKKLAYWGHGRDMQGDLNSKGEKFKRYLLPMANWWFAYTRGAAEYVKSCGYDAQRITTVQNAVDTERLRGELASVTVKERADALSRMGWTSQHLVGVYCGSLYTNKNIDDLIVLSDRIHAAIPEFRLLIMGSGPELEHLTQLAAGRHWVAMVGPKFGHEKAVYLSSACVWLNPGLVGLGVLDAFCAGLPVITRFVGPHSPEIEYIDHGVNGLVLVNEGNDEFADQVIDLLQNPQRLTQMQQAALNAANNYSIQTMIDNFSSGVRACLAH